MLTHNQVYAHNQQGPPPASNNGDHDDLLTFLNGPIPNNANLGNINGTANGTTNGTTDDVRNSRKQRLVSSPQKASSSKKTFKYKKGLKSGIIDDPNFAPPPVYPIDDNLKPSYQLNAEYEADYVHMPKREKIRHSGHIMTRFSAVSLLTKKWKQNFWILYGDCLYFFRSKDDFDEWLLNPYLIKEKRASLVKRYLNFNDGEAVNFQVDKVGMKYYRKGGMMYHFKLDKMYIRGPAQSLHLVAAFSSMNESDVVELNTLLLAMLGKTTKSSSRRSGAFSETHSAYSSGYAYTDGYSSAASAGF